MKFDLLSSSALGRIFLLMSFMALVSAWMTEVRGQPVFGLTQQHLFYDAIALGILGIGCLMDSMLRRKGALNIPSFRIPVPAYPESMKGEVMERQDPVCGMDVNEDTPYQATHEEERYYFCSADCKQAFEKTLQQYAGGGDSHEVH